MPTDQTWVRPNFFDSIQLSHRNFWFRLNSWLTIGFQALIKINSDSKWLAGSWFKSTHDSKGLTEFWFKSTESFPEFWFKWLMTQHSGILIGINSWPNYTLNSIYIHSPVYFQNLFHSIWLSWAFWAFDLSVFPLDMTFMDFRLKCQKLISWLSKQYLGDLNPSNSYSSVLPGIDSDSTHDSSGFPRYWFRSTHGSSGFPRNQIRLAHFRF